MYSDYWRLSMEDQLLAAQVAIRNELADTVPRSCAIPGTPGTILRQFVRTLL